MVQPTKPKKYKNHEKTLTLTIEDWQKIPWENKRFKFGARVGEPLQAWITSDKGLVRVKVDNLYE